MFGKLFAEAGLSLDRLRVLIEVGAAGSIVRAAGGDSTRQSQYSRQLKELEDFFQITLVERHGKSLRLTANGRELARISRFFLLGLSNFQRGCLAGGQTYRLGASATFNQTFLVPLLAGHGGGAADARFTVQTLSDAEIERRLHDLTLDFGVVTRAELSRPLLLRKLGGCRLNLWVPKALCSRPVAARMALRKKQLPLAWPAAELDAALLPGWTDGSPALMCDSFLDVQTALAGGRRAGPLPDFLPPGGASDNFLRLSPAGPARAHSFAYHLAWNPRLIRLNPHAGRQRDALAQRLSASLRPAA